MGRSFSTLKLGAGRPSHVHRDASNLNMYTKLKSEYAHEISLMFKKKMLVQKIIFTRVRV